jgi:uncharacterized protein (TIGR03437 family)
MTKKLLLAVSLPALLLAHEYGPDPGYEGAPKEPTVVGPPHPMACASAGCHTGLPNGGPINNFASGGVVAVFSSGSSYTPGGGPITISVSVMDPVNTHYGFQMSARPESDLANTQAGDFTPGANQIVICADGSVKLKNCPAGSTMQYVEHSYPQGHSVGTTPYTFTWTPPATNVGKVHFYVAGNAVNNNLQADGGDHVYTAEYILSPVLCSGQTPAITSIDSASAYGGYSYFASGSWLEIKGTNLANPADPRLQNATQSGQWTAQDFTGANAPTSLDGVSVSINGKPAYVWYLSPTQLNVQAPDDSAVGTVAITVGNCSVTSAPVMFARQALAPGLLAPPNYAVGGTPYLVATFASDGAYVLNTSAGAAFGLNSRPAKPGDVIIAYGIGFGDVTPSILPGVITQASNALTNPVAISFGSVNAALSYSGLAGSFVGLYEFYITVPPSLADGDYPIHVTQNGVALPQNFFLTVHH